VRVGLADDSRLFRAGLAALLEASGIQIVLQVGTGQELMDQVGAADLDAVVVDIRMPPTFTEEGLDAADLLRVSHPAVAVLVLSTYAETAYAARVLRYGAAGRGYLLKDALDDPRALRRALERLYAGGSVLDPSIVQRLMGGTRRREPLSSLSSRQRTIVRMLAEGHDDDAIAAAVNVGWASIGADIDETLDALGIQVPESQSRLLNVVSWLRAEPEFHQASNT
jgi:DNA-binding NarL/FixJ family response regulator